MSSKLILIENCLDADTWLHCETDNVCEMLVAHFNGVWPDTARIYYEQVATAFDVTPIDEAGVKKLAEMEGTFYCVVYPAGPLLIPALIALVVAVVAIAILMKPQVPNNALRNQQATSPNNELSSRTNSARIKGRIPDIYGTVRSTPDLISLSYSSFMNNQEVENSVMCIGRGEYQINDCYDGETPLSFVAGSSVQVYAPFTDILSGLPYFSVGSPITIPPKKVTKSNSVNGQILRAPNSNSYTGTNNIYFQYPDKVVLSSGSTAIDFTELFSSGDSLTIARAGFSSSGVVSTTNIQPLTNSTFRFPMPSGGIGSLGAVGDSLVLENAIFVVKNATTSVVEYVYDLSGSYIVASISSATYSGVLNAVIGLTSPVAINPQWANVPIYTLPQLTPITLRTTGVNQALVLDGVYPIVSVTKTLITLGNPAAINPAWASLSTLPGQQTVATSPILTVFGVKWVGPFILEQTDRTEILVNVVAQNGIYLDNGSSQAAYSVTVEIEIQEVNNLNNPIGTPQLNTLTLQGSAVSRDQVALTGTFTTPFVGRCQVRMRRSSPTDTTFQGSVIDEVKWRDLYAATKFKTTNFGNVTVLRSITYATTGALSLKERKLNMEVMRKIPLWAGGKNFTPDLHPTNDAAEIISAISLDPRIGNRSPQELDFDSIYAARDESIAYFGTDLAFQFCYTFDSDNMSFEETISSISSAVFCQCYRRGNIIKLMFERETQDSSILFNHRNKVPKTETRTVTFGRGNDNDGVEFEWVSPIDDAVVTYFLPEDKSALNPKKIESIGVRNGLHAYIHVHRYWNRMQFENKRIEFEATQEANTLVLQDRILNSDGTRPDAQDGDITEQDGLLLIASRELRYDSTLSYSIFLQLSDGTVQSIPVQSINKRQILLKFPPRLPLVTAAEMYARTTFILNSSADKGTEPFLVTNKEPVDNFSTKITAVNYSDKYWQNDKDYINKIVDISGNLI